MPGKHRKRKPLPPKVPLHPSVSAAVTAAARAAPGTTPPASPQQDMTLFEAYRDLQLRWKRTTRQSRKKFSIARKWRQHLACRPQPEPSWLLFLHPQMGGPRGASGGPQETPGAPGAPSSSQQGGRRRRHRVSEEPQLPASLQGEEQQQEQQQQPQEPKDGVSTVKNLSESPMKVQEEQDENATGDWVGGFRRVQGTHAERPPPFLSYDPKEIFCVFKSSVSAQHKASFNHTKQQQQQQQQQQPQQQHRQQQQ
ncbi:hypothetical protein Emag_005985 [Eimeria magna]